MQQLTIKHAIGWPPAISAMYMTLCETGAAAAAAAAAAASRFPTQLQGTVTKWYSGHATAVMMTAIMHRLIPH